jgi:hypothetical protein
MVRDAEVKGIAVIESFRDHRGFPPVTERIFFVFREVGRVGVGESGKHTEQQDLAFSFVFLRVLRVVNLTVYHI